MFDFFWHFELLNYHQLSVVAKWLGDRKDRLGLEVSARHNVGFMVDILRITSGFLDMRFLGFNKVWLGLRNKRISAPSACSFTTKLLWMEIVVERCGRVAGDTLWLLPGVYNCGPPHLAVNSLNTELNRENMSPKKLEPNCVLKIEVFHDSVMW